MWAHIVKERKLQKTKNCQEWKKWSLVTSQKPERSLILKLQYTAETVVCNSTVV